MSLQNTNNRKTKWSLFQSFCCGPKQQPTSNRPVVASPNSVLPSTQMQIAESQSNTVNYSRQPSSTQSYEQSGQQGSPNSFQQRNSIIFQSQQHQLQRGQEASSDERQQGQQDGQTNPRVHQQSMFARNQHDQQRQLSGRANNAGLHHESRQLQYNQHRRTQSHNVMIHGSNSNNNHLRAIQEDEGLYTHNSDSSMHSFSSPQQQRYNFYHHPSEQEQTQPIRYYSMANEFFKLKTKFAIHEVDFVDCRPTDTTFQGYFNYDCPICYRHFNRILKSDCCENYLCHYCLRDIYNKAKDKPNFEYHCMFCQVAVPSYVDVEQNDKIKRYSDSPFMIITPKDTEERTVAPFSMATATGHNIHNSKLIEFQDESMERDKENEDLKQNEINIVNNCNREGQAKNQIKQTVHNPRQQGGGGDKILRERQQSISENENVNQSAHKPAGQIPEFQNKYHCNYLQQPKSIIQGGSKGVSQQPIQGMRG